MSQDRTIDGLTETDLLWVLIALAQGEVERDAVIAAFGVPSVVVETMQTVAGLRGQAAIERALLGPDRMVPPVVLARRDDIAGMLAAVQAWVPRTIIDESAETRAALARLSTIVKRAQVWTNN